MNTYVGIDVHRSFFQVAIIPESIMTEKGKAWEQEPQHRITSCRADFDKLLSMLKEHTNISIAIDHTGGHYSAPLVNLLINQGYEICYIHPSGLKNFMKGKAQINKTDKIDAAYMARALYYHKTHGDDYHFSLLNPKIGTDAELLRTLISQRQMITKQQTQTLNRLHHLLVSTFPEAEEKCFDQLLAVLPYYPTAAAISKAGLDELYQIRLIHKRKLKEIYDLAQNTIGVNAASYGEAIRNLAMQYQDNELKLKLLEQRLHQVLDEHPYTKILTSIPCISTISAATLIASIGDINHFQTKNQLRKQLGISPKIKQSGNGAGKSTQAPGDKNAKRVLFQAVFGQLNSKTKDTDFRDYYHKKKSQGMHGTKALVATMGQLTEVIYHCLKNGEFYEYQGGKNEGN